MVYRNIVETEEALSLQFQQLPSFEPHAKACIQGILQSNANIRLGMMHDGMQELWDSPFFNGERLFVMYWH